MKVIDRRNQALGGQRKQRELKNIEYIGVHWDGVTGGTIEGHERHWRNNLGWGVGGYHYFVRKDGTIIHNYNLERITNGVGDHNSKSAHVSYAGGYGSPMNEAQRKAVKYVINELMLPKLPNVKQVWGHNEFPDTARFEHSKNACPGINMNDFRAYLDDDKVNVSAPRPKPANKPKISFDAVVKNAIAGKYGNYPERQANIEALGHDYGKVQAEIDRRLLGTTPKTTKSIDQLAREVIDGKHGTGDARKRNLGSRYNAVQKRVNEILGAKSKPKGKSIDTLAKEVIDGKYGTGEARKRALGSQYQAVQNRVNQILGAGGSSKKSIDTIAREVIDGKWGNDPERSRRLRQAGYDANAVQRRVNQLL